MRVSVVVQYLAFGSAVLSPWLFALGIFSFEALVQVAGIWLAAGVIASIWHRNVEESR